MTIIARQPFSKIGWIACALGAAVSVSSRATADPVDPGAAEQEAGPSVRAEGEPAEPGARADVAEPGAAPNASEAVPDVPPAVDVTDVEAAFAGQSPEPTQPRPVGSGLMNPDLSLILDVAAAYFSEDGRFQTGAHDPVKTGFNLQQLELSAGAAVDPYLRFDANLVFSLFGVELEEAYATTLELPLGLQARFGQFLTRFGRMNRFHPHAWDFVDQPFSIGRVFGAEGNRGLGVEVSWLLPLPWSVELIGSALNADGEGTMRSFYGARDLGISSVRDFTYVTALQQFFPLSDDWSLAFGVSGAFGPNSTGRANRTDVYGTDLYLKYRPITRRSSTVVALTSEWFYRRRQIPGDLLQDLNGYSSLLWKFSERWGVAARYEYGSPSYGEDGRVSSAEPLDPEWTRSRHRVSQNLTFWPSEFSRFRLQVGRDMPGTREPVWSVFLAAEIVAGAHGAHAF
jgi:hypothetical protein